MSLFTLSISKAITYYVDQSKTIFGFEQNVFMFN